MRIISLLSYTHTFAPNSTNPIPSPSSDVAAADSSKPPPPLNLFVFDRTSSFHNACFGCNGHQSFQKLLCRRIYCRCHLRGSHKCRIMCPPLALSSSSQKKLRVLCLHGFRTSGSVMETQLGKLDRSVLDLLDMVCLDGPYPAAGKSDVEGFFDPPFYEWFQYEKNGEDGATFTNLGECIEFIADVMHKQGPFDGLVGFSQGAFLAAALAGMQQQGLALTTLPALRFVMIISGGVLSGEHQWKDCYSKPIQCPSVHLIGANDFLKSTNEDLVTKFERPVLVRHGARHTIPRLDEKAALPIKTFLQNILGSLQEQEDQCCAF